MLDSSIHIGVIMVVIKADSLINSDCLVNLISLCNRSLLVKTCDRLGFSYSMHKSNCPKLYIFILTFF